MVESVAPVAPARPRPLVAAAIVGTLLLWASAFVAIRAIGDTFGPGSMALLRLVAGSAALTVFVLARSGGRFPARPDRGSAALIVGYGVLWFAGYTVALNAAERHLDAGTAAMLVNVAPILVAVVAGRLLGEGYPRPLLVGIVVSFTGVAVIAVGGPGVHGDWLGVLLGLTSALLYAAGVLTQKITLRRADALTATWLGCVVGTVVLLPFAGPALDELSRAPWPAIAAVLYLGIFPTAVGFTLWAYALTRTDAGAMAATTLAVPGIVVLMSWAALGELPTVAGLLGGALCLLGVAISAVAPGAEWLVSSIDRTTAWAWLPVRAQTDPVAAVRAVRDVLGSGAHPVRVACGEVRGGLDGFRATHRQAVAAQSVALVAGPDAAALTEHAEVGAIALLCADLDATRVWVGGVLGPLATADAQHARLRETLLAFLTLGSSYTAAAEQLLLHRNSVRYRVARAEQVRGRPIRDDRFDVELALRACRGLGRAVLSGRPADAGVDDPLR